MIILTDISPESRTEAAHGGRRLLARPEAAHRLFAPLRRPLPGRPALLARRRCLARRGPRHHAAERFCRLLERRPPGPGRPGQRGLSPRSRPRRPGGPRPGARGAPALVLSAAAVLPPRPPGRATLSPSLLPVELRVSLRPRLVAARARAGDARRRSAARLAGADLDPTVRPDRRARRGAHGRRAFPDGARAPASRRAAHRAAHLQAAAGPAAAVRARRGQGVARLRRGGVRDPRHRGRLDARVRAGHLAVLLRGSGHRHGPAGRRLPAARPDGEPLCAAPGARSRPCARRRAAGAAWCRGLGAGRAGLAAPRGRPACGRAAGGRQPARHAPCAGLRPGGVRAGDRDPRRRRPRARLAPRRAGGLDPALVLAAVRGRHRRAHRVSGRRRRQPAAVRPRRPALPRGGARARRGRPRTAPAPFP